MLDITFANPHFLWLLIPLIGGLIWRWFSVPASIAVSSTEHYTKTAPRKHFAPRQILLLLEFFAAAAFLEASESGILGTALQKSQVKSEASNGRN